MKKEKILQRHLENRDLLLAAIAGEVFGPGSSHESPNILLGDPTPVDLTNRVVFENWQEYSQIRPVDKETGEEILRDERPGSRYGMGILFPQIEGETSQNNDERIAAEDAAQGNAEHAEGEEEPVSKEEAEAVTRREKEEAAREKRMGKRVGRMEGLVDAGSPDDEDTESGTEAADLRLSNLRQQRSIGVSFVIDAASPGDLVIKLTGGRYKRFKNVTITERKSPREIIWWVRLKIESEICIPFAKIMDASGSTLKFDIELPDESKLPPLDLKVEILTRGRERIPGNDHPQSARLLTVSVVNRTKCNMTESLDEKCLFQTRFSARSNLGGKALLPYPKPSIINESREQQSLDLLYRDEHTFATGHGCAGTWEAEEGAKFANIVTAEPLPSSESPAITPELKYKDSQTNEEKILAIPLAPLGDDDRFDEAVKGLNLMANLYEKWIDEKKSSISRLEDIHQASATRHVEACEKTLEGILRGIKLISDDKSSHISLAFRLTNKVMLTQALASRAPSRTRTTVNTRDTFIPSYADPDLNSDDAIKRTWRPFQIAFLLMNIAGLSDPQNPGREIVDLIWFPTGGGKTEAYLACAAFSIFMRRLKNPDDAGTHVLMRYTLRLLTAQQFQRASSLICAMELARKENTEQLGTTPFSIGIWVGGGTTPNSRTEAAKSFTKAKRNGEEDYKMVMLKCPWCGAKMGPIRGKGNTYEILGVKKAGGNVFLHCPDLACKFSDKLPVEVIDEDIYKTPPTYVIATVDKFASLAWKNACRGLFGINSDGERISSPPGLIIQDELHLITGPLGSMVGLYETLIDELSTDYRDAKNPIKPKLIAATATTRASSRQIQDLYARDQTSIFPPPGIDAGDSFFARYDRDSENKRKPGRRYVGILPLSYSSSLTASVRLYSAVLAAANGLKTEEERDPWWSLLVFYNSLRELGGGFTLFTHDIPDRMKNLQRRWFPGEKFRFIGAPMELTGRLANSEVPKRLEELTRKYIAKPARGEYPVDACLASNIIEVGVDVDRLAIMGVAGQPKTTAQYIQATGRVGRNLPGMIFINYGATKARDRSHYEHFQTYHSRLYAQVEPASVTPFTIPVLERAMHAVLVAYCRQTLTTEQLLCPSPFEGTALEAAVDKAYELLKRRIEALSGSDHEAKCRMLGDLDTCYQKRLKDWKNFNPVIWHEYFPKKDSGDQPLLRPYGSPCPPEWVGLTWETPNSLRGVDAECKPTIPHYLSEPSE